LKSLRIIAAALAVTASTGCYNLVVLNLGSSVHEALSVGPPQPPEVQCEALATPKITGPIADIDAVDTCLEALAAQKKLDAKKKK
jgi:hypothetical protein